MINKDRKSGAKCTMKIFTFLYPFRKVRGDTPTILQRIVLFYLYYLNEKWYYELSNI